jgi:hypothetical protein
MFHYSIMLKFCVEKEKQNNKLLTYKFFKL